MNVPPPREARECPPTPPPPTPSHLAINLHGLPSVEGELSQATEPSACKTWVGLPKLVQGGWKVYSREKDPRGKNLSFTGSNAAAHDEQACTWAHGLAPKPCVHPKSLQSCPALCDPTDCRLLCPWDSLGMNTGVVCHSLLWGIFSAKGLN